MSEPMGVPSAHPGKLGHIFYDNTDLNANNFSVDQDLFLREIKQEPECDDDESRDPEFEKADKDERGTIEGQTWFVTIKREACFGEQDGSDNYQSVGANPKNDEELFTCDDCGLTFKRKDQLLRHLITHGLIDPYTCNLCGKTFNRKDVLQKHISIVHGFALAQTGDPKTFTNLTYPFSCDVCQKTFKRFDSVKRHKRSHFNERDFDCHLCDMKFTQVSILTRHIRSHTKEAPFSCGMCNKKYTRKYILARHIGKKHTKKVCHPCDRCHKQFQTDGYLKKHLRQIHKVVQSKVEPAYDEVVEEGETK